MRPKTRHYILALNLASILFLCALPASALNSPNDDSIVIESFSTQPQGFAPKGWESMDFPKKKKSAYTVQAEGTNSFLLAESDHGASAVYKKIDFDLKDFPVLGWSWRVENPLNGNELTKEGDDYAARVYVTFEYDPGKSSAFDRLKRAIAKRIYGIEPPGAAVCYVWAGKVQKEQAFASPFTDKVAMIAVESGPENSGRWVREERNVLDDYRRFFKADPPRVTGVLLMTDTDNTGARAVARYDDITLKKTEEAAYVKR